MSTPPSQRPGALIYLVPLVSIALTALLYSLPFLWQAADLDPAPIGILRMVGVLSVFTCAGWLVVWFFGFTRISRGTKLGLFLLLLVGCVGFAASVREVVLDSDLIPSFRFRWQSVAEVAPEEYDQREKIDLTIDPVNDFPRYRGAAGDGVVRPTELLANTWEEVKPREVWRHSCGGGFAGFAVVGNVAVTIEQRGTDEVVVCYDRATGQQRWAHIYPAQFKDPTGWGPRATPTISNGEVFSLGALGDLLCLDGATGTKKWGVNIVEDNGATVVNWGMTSSPLVEGDLVIVNAGVDEKNNQGRALVAYHRQTGQRVWGSGRRRAGYSSPFAATLAGRRQVVLFDAGGLAGYDVQSGKELWFHPWETFQDQNIIQPLVLDDDRIFLSSEVSNGCAMLRIQREKGDFVAEVLWENRYLASRQANPVRMGGYIYGLSNGHLVCLDTRSGQRRWRGRSFGQGQMLGVAGMLLIQSEHGELVLVAANPDSYRELGRMPVFTERRAWNTPALAGRYLYLRTDTEMVCLELPLKE
ncbi:MAG: PQQ-binding-like beta-propeller repeat protein [Gemmataceae bacterium]